MRRSEMLSALSAHSDEWDIVIVGGGATGLGAAVEAATRGHRVALVEASDFSSGTSSRSTKLIHGGVRYLQKGQVGMVRQSLRERGRLLRNAPHLVHLLDFVVPSYRTGSRWYYFAGLTLYDQLAGSLTSSRTTLLSKSDVLARAPTIRDDHLKGGVLYQDGQFDDSALAVALARAAARNGAVVVNHARVHQLIAANGRVRGLVARDTESDTEIKLRCKVLINATGIFADSLAELDRASSEREGDSKAGNHVHRRMVVPSQGSHIVVDSSFLPGSTAIMVPRTDDGRVLFIIPWHGRVLIGTTDIEKQQISAEPRPGSDEISYLLEHAGRYLTRQPNSSDILSMFAGMRPLVRSLSAGNTSQLSREHEILVSKSGLITVVGGKWTTYRQMGEDLIDRAEMVGELPKRKSITSDLSLTDPVLDSRVSDWCAEHPEWNEPLVSGLHYRKVDIIRAVRLEMAQTVEDVLARRLRLLFLDAAAAESVAKYTADILRKESGKSETWVSSQLDQFSRLTQMYRTANSGT